MNEEQYAGIHEGMQVVGADAQMIGRVARLELPASVVRARRDRRSAGLTETAAGSALLDAPAGVTGPAGGSLPLGTTTPKDRGNDTALREVAARGDPFTTGNGGQLGAAGLDMNRGYGVQRDDVALGAGERSMQSNSDSFDGGGVTNTLSATLRATGEEGSDAEITSDAAALLDEAATYDEADDSGEMTAGADYTKAWMVVEDKGTLGYMAQGLCIPFDAVTEVEPDRRVTLIVSRDEARRRYGRPGLQLDYGAGVA